MQNLKNSSKFSSLAMTPPFLSKAVNKLYKGVPKLTQGFFLPYLQNIGFEQNSIFYGTIFLLRMMLLKEKNPAVYKRLEFLMDGDTSDLQEKNSFSRLAFTFYIDKRK